ncbi:MAG: tetratricopeptide repeat protein [Myxococcales bacterium]|nr:tetratricopeptide repeat protein [Myxococcales bacterium]
MDATSADRRGPAVPGGDDPLQLGRPTGVFVGRRAELDWLKAQLCDPHAEPRPIAVCALQGMAGVGKSYLCDQFYGENRAAFPGGYLIVSLSPSTQPTPDSLLVELAARLRLDAPLALQASAVVARLRQPRTLLHIENVDTEAQATAVVDLVRQLAGCAVLVSARQTDVGLSPSLRWARLPVPPLPIDDALDQLSREFRAPRTASEAAQHRRIVEKLGALPLAVHLAAGRLTQGLRLESLLADIEQRVLDSRAADPGERSRDLLRRSILSSLQALERAVDADGDPELSREQVTPALAGLAHGPAAGVGESLTVALLGLGESSSERLLVRARGYSLVERTESADSVRWHLHPLVAATLRRASPPPPDGGLTALRTWFLTRLPQRLGAASHQQAEYWRAIQADEPALLHWLEAQPASEAAETARIGFVYACIRGPYATWGALCQRGLTVAQTPDERIPLLKLLSEMQHKSGQLDAALASAQEGRDLAKASGDQAAHAIALGQLADIYQARGQLDEALRIRKEEQLPVFETLGDIRSRAVTMGQIADIYQTRGQLDEALRIYQENIPIREKLGDVRGRAVTMGKIADIYEARGQLDEALRIRKQEALPVYETLGDIRSRAVTMGQIADIYQARGQLDEALRLLREEVLPVYRALKARREILVCETNIALGLVRRNKEGDRVEAEGLLRRAHGEAVEMRLPEADVIAGILATNF